VIRARHERLPAIAATGSARDQSSGTIPLTWITGFTPALQGFIPLCALPVGRALVSTRPVTSIEVRIMSDPTNVSAAEPAPGNWTVTGIQTAPSDDGRTRVEIVIRGKVEGVRDRGGGVDQLRFSVWDDGLEMDFKIVDIPLGRSGTVTVRLGFDGRYAIVADGIGIAITAGSEADGERVFDLDPFFPDTAP